MSADYVLPTIVNSRGDDRASLSSELSRRNNFGRALLLAPNLDDAWIRSRFTFNPDLEAART